MQSKTVDKNEQFQATTLREYELEALSGIAENFETFPISTQEKLANFPNWVRHRDLARFLAKYEIFKSILDVPGAIFECGVLYGGGFSTWLHLNEIFEPVNFSRKVYGFDTFSGFVDVDSRDIPDDISGISDKKFYEKGSLSSERAENHLFRLAQLIDETRKIPQMKRAFLVKGDASKTVPDTLQKDKSLLVSLLYLDMDLYLPTKEVINACLPRMTKGSVIVLDELCDKRWPGETEAVCELFDMNKLKIKRFPTTPTISYAIVGE